MVRSLADRTFQPRSWKDDRGRIGTATVKFTLGVGLSCVAAEETDQGMAILLFENPEGRGRLTEGNWTFNGRECEYTMHENGTIYYGESRSPRTQTKSILPALSACSS